MKSSPRARDLAGRSPFFANTLSFSLVELGAGVAAAFSRLRRSWRESY